MGIAALALVALAAGWRAGRTPHLLALPSVALLGLILLSLFQATPLGDPWLRRLAPAWAETRAALAPATPERVYGEEQRPVAPPAPTLSENPDATLHTATQLTAAWVLFQAMLALGGGYAALRRFGTAVACNSALLALFALVQALSWNGKIYWVRPSPMGSGWNTGGPFVGHSPLAAELNVGMGFALALLLIPSAQRRFRPWAIYSASVIAVGVVASHSRTGFLAMAVSLLVCAAALRSSKIRPGAGLWVGLSAMLIVIPVLLIALGQTSHFSRIESITERSAYSARLEIWSRALAAWRQRPLFGSGLGTFMTAAIPQFQHDGGLVYTRAEDEYLDVLVEGGVIGLGLLLLLAIAVARSGRDALTGAASSRDRLVVLGALFGILSLAIHSLGDFALHIPAVGVLAVVLTARICALGLDARAHTVPAGRRPRPGATPFRSVRWAAAGLATLLTMVFVVRQGTSLARAEAALAGTGLPLPGSGMPDVQAENAPLPLLKQRRAALEAALSFRPDWAEGHLRLGLMCLGLYRADTRDWLGEAAGDPEQAARLVNPLWLHGVIHGVDDPGRLPLTPRQIADQEPVRKNLVAAARSFLEARRCCPTLALAHAELAQLDYLLAGGEPVAAHAGRALRLAGGSADLLILAAQAALQANQTDLACRCWRAALAVRPAGWREIADAVGVVLPPETILNQILTLTPGGGRLLVLFADRLYAEPEDEAVRTQFLRAALLQLPTDPRVSPAERQALEARACAGLGDHSRARRRMTEALRAEPDRTDWRLELIVWLIEWGEPAEARKQALLGRHHDPANPDLKRALEAAAEALALGE
jgi:O-antigen ligase